MKLAVVGGSGGTGLKLIEKALAEGDQVTALVRHPEALRKRFPKVQVIQGDVFIPSTIKTAIQGAEAIISTLGFSGRSRETKIYSEGVLNIARAMEEIGPRRLIVLAASQGIDPDPNFPWYASVMMKLFIKPIFGFAYRDMAKMTDLLAKSTLNWTLVGVPLLTNSPEKGKHRNSIGEPLQHAFRISRGDVAEYLISIIDNMATFRKWTEVAW